MMLPVGYVRMYAGMLGFAFSGVAPGSVGNIRVPNVRLWRGISYVADGPVLSLVVDPGWLYGYVGSLRQVRALLPDVDSGCHSTDNLPPPPTLHLCDAARSKHRYIHIRPEVVGWAHPV